MNEFADRDGFARALAFLLAGLVLVVVDVRINAFDLLPDPVGWLLVAGALRRCRAVHDDAMYRLRMDAAWLLALVSFGLSFVSLSGALGAVVAVAMVTPIVFATAAFARLARVTGDDDLRLSWETSGIGLVSACIATGVVYGLRLDVLVLPVVIVTLVAFGHIVLSIRRTRRACIE